jgi:predicted phosphoribosyltransferase
MFRNRKEAGLRLAEKLKYRELHDPVVLAIPCGGLAIGAVLARELGAELDVVLSRKLRAPGQSELSVGAISENGETCLNHLAQQVAGLTEKYLAREREYQLSEMARQRELFNAVRARAILSGRSVILTDDGIATGSTIMAALQVIKSQHPYEVIVAVPVASMDSSRALEGICRACDEFVCLHSSRIFWGIDQYYSDFTAVRDDEAVELLRAYGPAECPAATVTARS